MSTSFDIKAILPTGYKVYRLNGNPIELFFLANNLFKNGQPRYNSYRLFCNGLTSTVGTQIKIAGDTYTVHSAATYDSENPYHIFDCTIDFCFYARAIIEKIRNNPNRNRNKYKIVAISEQIIVYDTLSANNVPVSSTCLAGSNLLLYLVAIEPDLPLNVEVLNILNAPHPEWSVVEVTELENYTQKNNYKVVVYPFVNSGVFDAEKALLPSFDINFEYYNALPPQSVSPTEKFGKNPNIADADRISILNQFPTYYPYSYDKEKTAYFNLQGLTKGIFDREDLPNFELDELNNISLPGAYLVPKFYSQKELLILYGASYDGNYTPYVPYDNTPCGIFPKTIRLYVLNGRLPDPYADYYYKQIYCKDYLLDQPPTISDKPIYKVEAYLENYYYDGSTYPIKFLSSYGKKYHCPKAADYLYFITNNLITQSTINDFYLTIAQKCENGTSFAQYLPLNISPEYPAHSSVCPTIDGQIVEIKLKNIDLFATIFSGCDNVYEASVTVSYYDTITNSYIPILIPITYLKSEFCCGSPIQLLFKNRFGMYETLLFDKKISTTVEVDKEQTLMSKRGFLHQEDPVRDVQDSVSNMYEKITLLTKNLDKEIVYDLLHSESVYYIDNTTSPANLYPVVLENKEAIIQGVQNILEQKIVVKRRIK